MTLNSHKGGTNYLVVTIPMVFFLCYTVSRLATDASNSVSVLFGLVGAMFVYADSVLTKTRDESNERLKSVAKSAEKEISTLRARVETLEAQVADLQNDNFK